MRRFVLLSAGVFAAVRLAQAGELLTKRGIPFTQAAPATPPAP